MPDDQQYADPEDARRAVEKLKREAEHYDRTRGVSDRSTLCGDPRCIVAHDPTVTICMIPPGVSREVRPRGVFTPAPPSSNPWPIIIGLVAVLLALLALLFGGIAR